MYEVILGDVNTTYKTIYYPGDEQCVIYDAKLNLEVGSAGLFEFRIPPTNPLYSEIIQSSIISIMRDDEEFWRGYVTETKKDFDKIMSVYCSEDLMWLSEEFSYYPFKRTAWTYAQNFSDLITQYNASHSTDGRSFNMGIVTNLNANEVATWVNTYEYSDLECLRVNLCQDNGYLKVRRVTENGHVTRYIDSLRLMDYGRIATQIIEFSDNLLDYAEEIDGSNIVNVLYPAGAEIDEEFFEGQRKRIHGTTILNNASITRYGRKERRVIFDTDDMDTLNRLAAAYLTRYSQPQLKLNLTAIDLADLGQGDAHFNIGDQIHVIAEPFGIDQWIYVTEQDIDLQNPASNKVTLADNVKVGSKTLTQQTIDTAELMKTLPNESSIVESARQTALKLLQGADGGHVSFGVDSGGNIDELRIANAEDIDEATKKWVWNVNGLGYMERATSNDEWSAPEIAMTMDGSIVADSITSGSLMIGNGGNDAPLLQAYSGGTKVAEISRSGLFAILGQIGGFMIGQDKLWISDSVISKDMLACGSSGYGMVVIAGGRGGWDDERYGFIQISNAGNPYYCLDGIRIYGTGKVVRFDGNGNVTWTRWLSNIPEQ